MIIPFGFLSKQDTATDFTTGLVAAWQFENDFLDYTANNHDATATGTVTNNTTGKVGNQADFGGVSSYLTVPDHNDFSFGDGLTDVPFTFDFWVKFDTFNVVDGVMFINKKHPVILRNEWQFAIDENKILFITLQDQSSGAGILAKYDLTSVFSLNTWFKITATYDGSSTFAGISIYVDGVSKTTVDGSWGAYVAMENLAHDVFIATRGWNTSVAELDGKLDEVKIYKNRELTASEVLEMYNKENAGISVLP